MPPYFSEKTLTTHNGLHIFYIKWNANIDTVFFNKCNLLTFYESIILGLSLKGKVKDPKMFDEMKVKPFHLSAP